MATPQPAPRPSDAIRLQSTHRRVPAAVDGVSGTRVEVELHAVRHAVERRSVVLDVVHGAAQAYQVIREGRLTKRQIEREHTWELEVEDGASGENED